MRYSNATPDPPRGPSIREQLAAWPFPVFGLRVRPGISRGLGTVQWSSKWGTFVVGTWNGSPHEVARSTLGVDTFTHRGRQDAMMRLRQLAGAQEPNLAEADLEYHSLTIPVRIAARVLAFDGLAQGHCWTVSYDFEGFQVALGARRWPIELPLELEQIDLAELDSTLPGQR